MAGIGIPPHDVKPFDLLQPQHRYYEYEFERYWHFFQVFGRIGYNPAVAGDILDREFVNRFGKTTGPLVEDALHKASGILPRIIASCYPYSSFPTTRGWAEKQHLGDLPVYAKAEGSDLCQFASFNEEAQLLLKGGETAKIRPSANSRWLAQRGNDVLALVAQIKKQVTAPGKELSSTIVDLEILSWLALYHAERTSAAVYYCLYNSTQDVTALDSAIVHEQTAIHAWQQIVSAAGDYYNYDLMMGVRNADLSGHWRDELVKLEEGLKKLQLQKQQAVEKKMITKSPVYPIKPVAAFDQLFKVNGLSDALVAAGTPVTIRLLVTAPAGIKWIRLSYRAVNQQLEYHTMPMLSTGKSNEFQAVVPAAEIDPTWDFMYYVELMDQQGNGRIYPDLNKETPYRIIRLIRQQE